MRLYGYGAMVSLGGVLAFAFLWTRRKGLGLDENAYWTLVNLILAAGFLGGKGLFLLQYGGRPSFSRGYSVFGALASVIIVVAVYARRRGLSPLRLLDPVVWTLPFWHAFGRLGCFLAGCCHGRPTDWAWGVAFRDPRALVPPELLGVRLHPTQLLEAAGDALIALALWPLLRSVESGRRRPGLVCGAYLAGYGALRVALEPLRGDVSHGQALGLGMLAASAATFAWRARCSPSC